MSVINDKASLFKDKLLYEITVGRYPIGTKLPSERIFCQTYNISRTTARKSLDELENCGIIYRRPQVGAFVCEDAISKISVLSESVQTTDAIFCFPADQARNTLIQTIFTSCKENLPKDINLSIMFHQQGHSYNTNGQIPNIVIIHMPDGLEALNEFKDNVECLVLLNIVDDSYNYISADNYLGGKIMAQTLINSGHKDMACIGSVGFNEGSDFRQRFRGIEDVCSQNSANIKKHILSSKEMLDVTDSCCKWLKKTFHECPEISAIMALHDMLAIHVYMALDILGYKIPDDISVIGFDDQYYAENMIPPLVSVKFPAEALGLSLAEFIVAWSKGNKEPIQKIIAPLLLERKEKCSVKNI